MAASTMARILVLLLLSAVSSFCQQFGDLPPLPTTGVQLYLGSEDRVLPDYSMIRASQFSDVNNVNTSTNDGLWCQSAANDTADNGVWFLPNGTQVPVNDPSDFPVHMFYSNGQVALLRDDPLGSNQGLYTCIVADENGINQTLVVAAYRDTEYNSAVSPVIDGEAEFSLLSLRDAQPPVFTLSFNVTQRPPTDVKCIINGTTPLNLSSDDVNRRVLESLHPNITVEVSVTLRTRYSGQYQCSVTNARVDNVNVNTASTNDLTITVTSAPSNLTVTRLNSTSVLLSWFPSPAAVLGYEVFYDDGATRLSRAVGSANQEITLQPLRLDSNYTMFVVAFGGGDLPSDYSNIVTISTDVSFVFLANDSPSLIGALNVTLSCQCTVNVPQLDFELAIFDQQQNVISNTTASGHAQSVLTIQTVDITFPLVQPTIAGQYTCVAMLPQSLLFSQDYNFIVQVPDPTTASIELTTEGMLYETDPLSISCTISSAIAGVMVDINWSGPYGQLQSNSTVTISNTTVSNETVYTSVLSIASVSLAQNNTSYTCSFSIGADPVDYMIPSTGSISTGVLRVEVLPNLNPVLITTAPSTPAFNSYFSLSCSVDVEQEHNLTLAWSHNGLLLTNSSTAVVLEHSQNSTTVYSTLTITNVRLENLGVYTCTASMRIGEMGRSVSSSRSYTLQVTARQPNVTIYRSYNDDLVEGTYIDLICNSSNTDDSLFNTSARWFYNGEQIESTDSSYAFSTDENTHTLRINELTRGRDNGAVYMCSLSVLPTSFVAGNDDNATITLIVEGFNPGHFTVLLDIPFVTIGERLIMTCSVMLPERFSSMPQALSLEFEVAENFYFDVLNTDSITVGSITRNGSYFIREVTFDPVRSNNIDNYRCLATVRTIGKYSAVMFLEARLPPPILSAITVTPFPVYESTVVQLTCNITAPDVISHSVMDTGHWIDPNGDMIAPNGVRLMSMVRDQDNNFLIATLTISPIDNGDSSQFNDTGEYVYQSIIQATIESREHFAYNNISVFISVQDLPELQVTISSSGTSIYGYNFTLVCTVELIQSLPITVTWTHGDNTLSTSSSDNGLTQTLELDSLDYSMSGVYTCTASYNVTVTNDTGRVERQYLLNVSSLGIAQEFQALMRSPFSIRYTWQPPDESFGPFDYYLITINFTNGSESSIQRINPPQTQYILQGLSPHQLIQVTITVQYSGTVMGPPVTLSNYTLQYESSQVTNLTVNIINSSDADVTWFPPESANGIIVEYRFVLRSFNRSVLVDISINPSDSLTHNLNDLREGVAYELIVFAVNGAGNGKESKQIFFTKEGVPPAVSGVAVSRINGTHANVSWTPLSLIESRGFVRNYTVQYTRADNRKRQVLSVTVPSYETNVLLTNLNPTSLYTVEVFASTSIGNGNISETINSNRPDTSKFQIRAGPFQSCNVIDDAIKSSIRSAVITAIIQRCSCDFNEGYISGEDLTCIEQYPMDVFYRGNITAFGTINSTSLLRHLQDFISSTATLPSNYSFSFNSSCPLQYSSNDESVCMLTLITTAATVTPTSSAADNTGQLITVVAVSAVITIIVLLTVIIIIVIMVCCLYHKNRSTKMELEMHLKHPNYYREEFHRTTNIDEVDDNESIYEPLDASGNLLTLTANVTELRKDTRSTSLPYNPPIGENRKGRSQSVLVTSSSHSDVLDNLSPDGSSIKSGPRTPQLPLPPLPNQAVPENTTDSSYIPPNRRSTTVGDRRQLQSLGESPLMSSARETHSPRVSSSFPTQLTSLRENPEMDWNAVNGSGNRNDARIGFSVSSGTPKRQSQLTISSHMSDHAQANTSPSSSVFPISPASPNAPFSPEYAMVKSPLYTNMNPVDETEDQYIQMKTPSGYEVMATVHQNTNDVQEDAQQYEIPVPSLKSESRSASESTDDMPSYNKIKREASPLEATAVQYSQIKREASPLETATQYSRVRREASPLEVAVQYSRVKREASPLVEPQYSEANSQFRREVSPQEYTSPVSSTSSTRETTPMMDMPERLYARPVVENVYYEMPETLAMQQQQSTEEEIRRSIVNPQVYMTPVSSNPGTRESTPVPTAMAEVIYTEPVRIAVSNSSGGNHQDVVPQEYLIPVSVNRDSQSVDSTTDAPVNSTVDAPVDSTVDAPVDSRVGAPVDSTVDAPVDSTVDALVNSTIDAPVDSTTDTPVDSTVDAPVDSTVDAPVDSTVDALVDSTVDAPVDSTVDALVDSTVDALVDSTTDTPVDSTVDVPVDSTVNAPVDSTVDVSVDSTVDAPVDSTIDAPVDSTVDALVNSTVDTPVDSTVDALVDSTVDTPVDSTIDAPIDSTIDTPVDSTIDTPVDSTIDTPVDSTVDAPVDSTVDALVNSTVDAPVDSTIDAPVDSTTDTPVDSTDNKGVVKPGGEESKGVDELEDRKNEKGEQDDKQESREDESAEVNENGSEDKEIDMEDIKKEPENNVTTENQRIEAKDEELQDEGDQVKSKDPAGKEPEKNKADIDKDQPT